MKLISIDLNHCETKLRPKPCHFHSKLYRHRPQIALQEKLVTRARAGDKLGRHPTQSREKDGKGKQDLNHLITASASKAGKKMTRRQRQPKAQSGTKTSLGNTAAAAAKSGIMKGDKLGRQAGSGSQERSYEGRQAWETRRQRQNHEGRQAWETRRQQQPKAKS